MWTAYNFMQFTRIQGLHHAQPIQYINCVQYSSSVRKIHAWIFPYKILGLFSLHFIKIEILYAFSGRSLPCQN